MIVYLGGHNAHTRTPLMLGPDLLNKQFCFSYFDKQSKGSEFDKILAATKEKQMLIYHGGVQQHPKHQLAVSMEAGVHHFCASFFTRGGGLETGAEVLRKEQMAGGMYKPPVTGAHEWAKGCYSLYDLWRKRGMNRSEWVPSSGGTQVVRAFCDSGAFSFLTAGYNKKQNLEALVDDYVRDYVEFVKNPPMLFDFYVTFDYKVEAPLVYKMTKRLMKQGLWPVPVYHGDSSIDWLKRYIDDGHKLVGLSKRFFLNDRRNLRRFYDQCFRVTEQNDVAVHGFACTGNEMWEYPWWSVDSKSLIQVSGMLRRYAIVRGKLKMVDRLPEWKTWRDALKYNAKVFQEFVESKNGAPAPKQKRTLF